MTVKPSLIIILLGFSALLMAESDVPEKGNLSFNQELIFLFENKEWMSGHISGYSDFGWVAPATLEFEATSDTTILFGGYAIRRYSEDNEVNLLPLLGLNYHPGLHHQFNLGTLNNHHDIHEAIYASTRRIIDPTGEGIQWKYTKNLLKMDFWLDWQKLEKTESAEQFNTGITTQWSPIKNITLNHSFIHNHTGGQITEDITEIRQYGINNQIEWRIFGIQAGNNLTLGFSLINSEQSLNDVESSGEGSEFFLELYNTQKKWNSNIRLSRYQGSPQVINGSPLYSFKSLSSLSFSSVFAANEHLSIYLESKFDWIEGGFNSAQTINFNWTMGKARFTNLPY